VQTRPDGEKHNIPTIVTLHITPPTARRPDGLFAAADNFDSRKLIKELYAAFLKNDPLFHFFFEPDLIIRISNHKVLENIKEHLKKMNLVFEVYGYPSPPPEANKRRYGEDNHGPVLERLYDIYLPLFHLNAIAALTMSEDLQLCFMERFNHTFCNMAGDTRQEEAEKLAYLAAKKEESKPTTKITLLKNN
jgi:hypothetical protein